MDNHPNFPHPHQLLSSKELEKFTGLTPRFWESRRITGDSPPFIRISAKAVRYRWSDVSKWLEQRLCTSTKDKIDEKL
jgi:predicted DNA-binding transcriptional regulator AlpA